MIVQHPSPAEAAPSRASSLKVRRYAPIAVIVLAMIAVFATGAHRHISLETLVRHRMAIDAFIAAHAVAAVAAYMAIYIVVFRSDSGVRDGCAPPYLARDIGAPSHGDRCLHRRARGRRSRGLYGDLYRRG